MGIYLYCVTPGGQQPAATLTGIDGRTVEALAHAGLAYWFSELDARPEASLESVRQHNDVVEAAVTEQTTPVPLRFGQWLPDLERVRERITPLGEAHKAALERFGGALEFGIRVLDPEEPAAQVVHPPTGVSGREYLLALQQKHRGPIDSPDRAAVRARVQATLGALAREERFEALDTSHGVFSVAHLVARDRFDAYRAGTQALRNDISKLRFLVSGPWPPYSFAA